MMVLVAVLLGGVFGVICPVLVREHERKKSRADEKQRLELTRAEIKKKYGYDVETWEELKARIDKEGRKVND